MKQERESLKLLKHRIKEKKIIITRADKGSGLVAVDYDTYIRKGTKYIEAEAKAYEIVQDTYKQIIDKVVKTRDRIHK